VSFVATDIRHMFISFVDSLGQVKLIAGFVDVQHLRTRMTNQPLANVQASEAGIISILSNQQRV
jgi:hypothetical protein